MASVPFLALAGFLTLFVLMENSFIYFPYKDLAATPADVGLESEERWLQASDGTRLHGWWLRGRGTKVVAWYCGNAGNISHRLEHAKLLIDALGVHVLLVGYRGYGLSEGAPSETGLYLDGLAIYGEAARRVRPDDIILFGQSLGAAVAIDVAVQRPVGAVVLETPFLSLRAMARDIYPFIPSFLVRSRFDNEAKIARIAAPKLILHGDRDEIVPIAHAQKLFEIATAPKRFFVIPDALHNDTYVAGGSAYLDAWRAFFEELEVSHRVSENTEKP